MKARSTATYSLAMAALPNAPSGPGAAAVEAKRAFEADVVAPREKVSPSPPCTLHLAPCTLHPTPCTLHPAPCTLHPRLAYTLHFTPCTLDPATCTLHPAPSGPGAAATGAKRAFEADVVAPKALVSLSLSPSF